MLELLREFDMHAFAAINGLAGRSGGVDVIVKLLNSNHLAKGVPVMMLLWGLWFPDARSERDNRPKLVALLGVALVAILVGRALAAIMPFRARPMHTADLDPILVTGVDERAALDGWSSMPSDHAVLFFALAAGFWMVNRWAGLAALLHALFVVTLSRVYLAYHYPSDILVGGLVGVAVTLAVMPPLAQVVARSRVVERVETIPKLWYPMLFLVTFEVASMFIASRGAAETMYRLVISVIIT